jgi:hypothetical protein
MDDKTGSEVSRLNVKVSKRSYEQLERLRGELGASTYSEVIRSSLKLSSFLHEEAKENGKEIILRDKQTGKEERLIL